MQDEINLSNKPRKKIYRRQAITLANTLPRDIILDIQSRLPVKSLIRFRSVSKSWKNLVQDPFFIKLHSDQLRKHKKFEEKLVSVYVSNGVGKLYSLDFAGKSLPKSIKHPIDHPMLLRWKIWGSCNGLVCIEGVFAMGSSSLLYLWNPATAEIIQPCFSTRKSPWTCFQYSIGYSDNLNDYEVVRIATVSSYKSEVVVYSLQAKTWRIINDIRYSTHPSNTPGVLVKGSLYWKGLKRDTNIFHGGMNYQLLIIAFKIGGSHFREVKLCDQLLQADVHDLQITAYKERLCVLCNTSNSRHSYALWARNDYGVEETWEKKYDIPKLGIMPFAEYLVCFTNNGEALLRGEDGGFILYEPHEQSCCAILGLESEKEKNTKSGKWNGRLDPAFYYAANEDPTLTASACTYMERLVGLSINKSS